MTFQAFNGNLHIVWFSKLKYGGINWSNPVLMLENLKKVQMHYNGGDQVSDYDMFRITVELYFDVSEKKVPGQVQARTFLRLFGYPFAYKSPTMAEVVCELLGHMQAMRIDELPTMPEKWEDFSALRWL